MPRVSDTHLEARRQQILAAAAACFARRGFHQTSIHDICREADLSPGAVYRYFESKEEIIRAMSEGYRAEHRALIESARARESDTLRLMYRLIDSFFGEIDDPRMRQVCALDLELWAEAHSNPRLREMLREGYDSYLSPFADIIHEAQERGEINPRLDPEAVSRAMVSLFDGFMMQRSLDPEIDVGSYTDVVKALAGGFFWLGRQMAAESVVMGKEQATAKGVGDVRSVG